MHPQPARFRVYPRVCGGTAPATAADLLKHGLSPRVRGNPAPAAGSVARTRSIPACAGEPRGSGHRRRASRVYPRVCGGTYAGGGRRRAVSGLSPRVRGNRQAAPAVRPASGSIPACAGEPAGARDDLPSRHGLSPRVRGNPPGQPPTSATARSIPRVCGGTPTPGDMSRRPRGLSPRVRGNHTLLLIAPPDVRSIPACAGEPECFGKCLHLFGVYPRVCGGTKRVGRGEISDRGLSPRVRGNPKRPAKRAACRRSIPACAGEPPGASSAAT